MLASDMASPIAVSGSLAETFRSFQVARQDSDCTVQASLDVRGSYFYLDMLSCCVYVCKMGSC